MTILLPALATAFAAFCVCLGVRIINRRERWAKWTLSVVVGLPVLYVASFGPWCWIVSHTAEEYPQIPVIFEPLTWSFKQSRVGNAVQWYTELGAADGWRWHADVGLVETADGNSTECHWLWRYFGP